MIETQNIELEARRSLNRILPRVEGIPRQEFSYVVHAVTSSAKIQHSNKDHYHEK